MSGRERDNALRRRGDSSPPSLNFQEDFGRHVRVPWSLRRTQSCPTIYDIHMQRAIELEEREEHARKMFHRAFGDERPFLPELFGVGAPFELADVTRITIPRPTEG